MLQYTLNQSVFTYGKVTNNSDMALLERIPDQNSILRCPLVTKGHINMLIFLQTFKFKGSSSSVKLVTH